ncbi:MAG: dienelactone hydrolase family protein [Planctomycetes bacterium]|nr:dienelactone hydrolase family protein [Planctomycetota bacterium]
MSINVHEIGGLNTRVVDALPKGAKPSLAVILCHGFGAPGTDLVGLGAEMLEASAVLAAGTRFYFPEAPLSLDRYGMWGGRAWWLIDFEAIQRAMDEGGFRQRARNERPDGMLEARAALLAMIEAVKSQTGLPTSRIALGGFSQGSFLTVDVATQLAETPAALIAWSGTLMNEDEWRKLAPRHAGLKVVQSHGRQDPLLPYEWAEHLRDFMQQSGWQVEWLPFDGPHTISPDGLRATVKVLEGLV